MPEPVIRSLSCRGLYLVGIAGLAACHFGTLAQTCGSPLDSSIPAGATFFAPDCVISSGSAEPAQYSVANVPSNAVYPFVSIGIKHNRCPDLDIVLVNPGSSKYLILSKGNGPTMPVTDDFTPSFADGNNPGITGCGGNCYGTYLPQGGSYGTNDPWPFTGFTQPAASASTLSQLVSGSPEGCWTLLIFDRQAGAVSWYDSNNNLVQVCSVGGSQGLTVGFSVDPISTLNRDSIDFNGDGLFPDDQDLIDFIAALGGNPCATCNDIDFNNDNLFPDDQDLIDFIAALAGQPC